MFRAGPDEAGEYRAERGEGDARRYRRPQPPGRCRFHGPHRRTKEHSYFV